MDAILFLLLLVALYFLPFIIALIRDVKNKTSVFFLNLFLGWTVIGFFVLIFYASLTSKSSDDQFGEWVKQKTRKKKK